MNRRGNELNLQLIKSKQPPWMTGLLLLSSVKRLIVKKYPIFINNLE